MSRPYSAALLSTFVILLGSLGGASAAEPIVGPAAAPSAKEIFTRFGPALVQLSGTVKTTMKFSGNAMPGRESRLDAAGVVIDADGTVITSANVVDPGRMMQKAMKAGGSMSGMDMKMDVASEHSNLRLRAPDGTQVPAVLVIIDGDRDLAVLRPDAKDAAAQKMAGKWPALAAVATDKAEVLDQILVLGRLGAQFDRQFALTPVQVTAQISKPRPCWIVNGGSPGGVALTRDGRYLGLITIQLGEVDFSSMMSASQGMAVVPAAEILELVKSANAPAAK